jgi:hypothetical protein
MFINMIQRQVGHDLAWDSNSLRMCRELKSCKRQRGTEKKHGKSGG